MSQFEDQQRSTDRLRQRTDALDRRVDRDAQEDIVIEYPRRLFMRSASGVYWQIKVSDAGAVTATDMGTSLP